MSKKRVLEEIDLNTAICETPPKKLKLEEASTPGRKSYPLDFKLRMVEIAKKTSLLKWRSVI